MINLKKFIVEVNGRKEMSGAAILLFAKNPQLFFERARVRFIRYEGPDAKFVTEPEYPEFVWKEIIVNAIAYRDYSIKGTDIQIKMFDDHITVESPGTLPGIVHLNNMREIHFSRNPKIAGLFHEYEYVREFGEGIDRMYLEMKEAGLPEPEYRTEGFMVYATIKNKKYAENESNTQVDTQVDIQSKILTYCKEPRSKTEITAYLGYKDTRIQEVWLETTYSH